jgi:thioesterase domain-containing protein
MPRVRGAPARGGARATADRQHAATAALPIDRARATTCRPTIEQRGRADAAARNPLQRGRCAADILGAVQNFDALAVELQSTWYREIPLTAALAIEVIGCSPYEISVRAPIAANRNLHGTVFAGSLYSVCVLTGWGMAWLALRQRDLAGSIVIADSRIQYRKGVAGDFVCTCRATAEAQEASLARFEAEGRASVPLVCTIDLGGRTAVSFEGDYVVRTHKPSS